jgi:uncharacterized protein (TIGR00297 family)
MPQLKEISVVFKVIIGKISVMNAEIGLHPWQIIISFLLAMVLATTSYRLKALSLSGALGTAVVGTVVFGFGGWPYAIPLLFFFISSNVLSRIKSEIKLASQKLIEKAGPRDIFPVLANGNVAVCCIIIQAITGDSRWFWAYLASLGVASADTWATEIGTLLSRKPVSIINFKKVNPGESGGVSIPGTLGSLIGSFATVFVAYPFVGNDSIFSLWLYAGLAGCAGSVIDSVSGATIQASYRCPECGTIVETKKHCEKKTELVRGLAIINNDVVNFLSNLLAVGIMVIISFLIP